MTSGTNIGGSFRPISELSKTENEMSSHFESFHELNHFIFSSGHEKIPLALLAPTRLLGSVGYSWSSSAPSLPPSLPPSLSLDWGFESDHQTVFLIFFCLLFLSSTLLSILRMFGEADNMRERRDFEEEKVKSHIRPSSAQPFNYKLGFAWLPILLTGVGKPN